ncbi:hypothetical protein WJX84_002225 [Apatococcus fuscideae]
MSGIQTRGSRHHWAGPNADPIPENEPVRPSGVAQSLLAPVRKVHYGETSPRSTPSPTLYESYLSSPTASVESGLDRQDSTSSTSETLEHCVRGGLPRLSSGLSSSCSSCLSSVPRAKSESNLALLAQDSSSLPWDRSIVNACRRKSYDASNERDLPSEHLVRGASSALDMLSQMRSSNHSQDTDVGLSASAGEAKASEGCDEAFPDSYASSSLTSGIRSQTPTDASNRTSFSSNASTGQDSPFEHAQFLDGFMPGEAMSLSPPSSSPAKSWQLCQPKPEPAETLSAFHNLSHSMPSCQPTKKPLRKVSVLTPYY